MHGPGIDEPLAIEDESGNPTYLHADGLGSVVKGTNSAGAVTLARQYDAWGNLQAGATIPGYAFTAREWDPEIGLYYYRARYYDPKIGRFISEDPLGLAGGMDLYTYVLNRPTSLIDPSGQLPAVVAAGAQAYKVFSAAKTIACDILLGICNYGCRTKPCTKDTRRCLELCFHGFLDCEILHFDFSNPPAKPPPPSGGAGATGEW